MKCKVCGKKMSYHVVDPNVIEFTCTCGNKFLSSSPGTLAGYGGQLRVIQ